MGSYRLLVLSLSCPCRVIDLPLSRHLSVFESFRFRKKCLWRMPIERTPCLDSPSNNDLRLE